MPFTHIRNIEMGKYSVIHCISFTSSFHAIWTSCMNLLEVSQAPALLFTNQVKTFGCQHPLYSVPSKLGAAGTRWSRESYSTPANAPVQDAQRTPSTTLPPQEDSHKQAEKALKPGTHRVNVFFVLHVFLQELFKHLLPPERGRLQAHENPKGELCAATATCQIFGSSFGRKRWIS